MIRTSGADFLTWSVIEDHHLEKSFRFEDFAKALEFVNAASEICELQDHHAEFTLSWGNVTIRTWSHDVDGITSRDYQLATAIDEVIANGP